MVAEGALGDGIARFDISFDDDLGAGRGTQRDSPAGGRGERRTAQKTGKGQLVKITREGEHGAEQCCRIAA